MVFRIKISKSIRAMLVLRWPLCNLELCHQVIEKRFNIMHCFRHINKQHLASVTGRNCFRSQAEREAADVRLKMTTPLFHAILVLTSIWRATTSGARNRKRCGDTQPRLTTTPRRTHARLRIFSLLLIICCRRPSVKSTASSLSLATARNSCRRRQEPASMGQDSFIQQRMPAVSQKTMHQGAFSTNYAGLLKEKPPPISASLLKGILDKESVSKKKERPGPGKVRIANGNSFIVCWLLCFCGRDKIGDKTSGKQVFFFTLWFVTD